MAATQILFGIIRLLLRSASSEASYISSYRQAIRATNDNNTGALASVHAHAPMQCACYERETRLSHTSHQSSRIPDIWTCGSLVPKHICIRIDIYVSDTAVFTYTLCVLENVYFPDPMTASASRYRPRLSDLRFCSKIFSLCTQSIKQHGEYHLSCTHTQPYP